MNEIKTTLKDELTLPVMGRSFSADTVSNHYNKFWLDYTGRSLEQELGDGWTENVMQEDIQGFFDVLTEAFNDRKPFRSEYRLKGRDGQYRWILETGYPQFSEKNEFMGYVSYAVDINDLKQTEIELRRSQRNLKDFIENSNIGLHWVNEEGIIIWANQAELDLLGYTKEEYVGQPISKFHADSGIISDILNRLTCNEKLHNYEAPLVCKDGAIRHVLISSSVLWEEGKFVHTRCFTRDITDRKQAEKELIEKHNELLKINNDLDNFIYTASHDLRAPISNIEGLLYTLKDSLPSERNDDLQAVLGMMDNSINRFKRTIQDLTDISKVQRNLYEDNSDVDLYHIIEDVTLSLNDQIKNSNVTIHVDINSCSSIKFSKANLKSIVFNLVNNAIKYKSPHRHPEISIRTLVHDESCILEVGDNGLGIRKENQEKIFSMFKRFHDHVEGSGIGLYIVKRIIENAGGKIEVESEEEKGSTFRVYFKTQ